MHGWKKHLSVSSRSAILVGSPPLPSPQRTAGSMFHLSVHASTVEQAQNTHRVRAQKGFLTVSGADNGGFVNWIMVQPYNGIWCSHFKR